MNNTLVANINEKVGQDDILFHLGDYSFGGFDKIQEFRDRIICKNIHLVLGNHDDHISNNKENIQTLFNSVNKYVDLVVTFNIGTSSRYDASFVLMHYPIASWNNMARGTIHLFGHIHSNPSVRLGPGKMMDVGMDGNNLYPISINEVLSIMSKQPIKSLFTNDHHEIVENYKK
jgi:calcineurin-like phosphoesterase family protein